MLSLDILRWTTQMTVLTQPRINPAGFMSWPVLPYGAEGGYGTEGDALPRITHLADGVSLDVIWREIQQTITAWNEHRSALTALLAYQTTVSADAIPQSNSEQYFELASEFGEPESLRGPSSHLLLGYTFNDYDAASRFTWKALRAMTTEQVRASFNQALEMDNRNVNGHILLRLFSPETVENEFGTSVYPFWSGDSLRPPAYLGKSFPGGHNHYMVSGGAVVDSGDLDVLIKEVQHHGYGVNDGQLVLLCNPEEADVISTFRVGTESAPGILPAHDFIPSEGSPAFFAPNEIVGTRAPEKFNRMRVSGSYGPIFVIPDELVPAGYLAVAATYGENSPLNAIAVREHENALYRGFRTIPGTTPGYPLIESFHTRGFGVGVRRRGQAAVMQVKTSGEYETPTIQGLGPYASLSAG